LKFCGKFRNLEIISEAEIDDIRFMSVYIKHKYHTFIQHANYLPVTDLILKLYIFFQVVVVVVASTEILF
jgi:hypothetical protein